MKLPPLPNGVHHNVGRRWPVPRQDGDASPVPFSKLLAHLGALRRSFQSEGSGLGEIGTVLAAERFNESGFFQATVPSRSTVVTSRQRPASAVGPVFPQAQTVAAPTSFPIISGPIERAASNDQLSQGFRLRDGALPEQAGTERTRQIKCSSWPSSEPHAPVATEGGRCTIVEGEPRADVGRAGPAAVRRSAYQERDGPAVEARLGAAGGLDILVRFSQVSKFDRARLRDQVGRLLARHGYSLGVLTLHGTVQSELVNEGGK
jgi:hypothetical protein